MLEIVPNDPLIHKDRMLLVCHVQLNAREPISHIHYYFYQDGLSLGPASSQDRVTVLRDSGRYWCKASIPTLGLKRLSEPLAYGRVTGEQSEHMRNQKRIVVRQSPFRMRHNADQWHQFS